MIIKKTGQELFQLIQGLNTQSVSTIKNTKLQYSIFRSRQKLFEFHKDFLKGYDQDPQYQVYQNELDNAIKNYRIANPEIVGNASPVDNNFEELKSMISTKYKNIIEKENNRINELNNNALQEYEIEVFGIKYEDLPDDLNVEQLQTISYLLI